MRAHLGARLRYRRRSILDRDVSARVLRRTASRATNSDLRYRRRRRLRSARPTRRLSFQYRRRCLTRTTAPLFREAGRWLPDRAANPRYPRVLPAEPAARRAIFAPRLRQLPQRADLSTAECTAEGAPHLSLRPQPHRSPPAWKLGDRRRCPRPFHSTRSQAQDLL